MSEFQITPVPETVADTRRVCEMRFDCLVTMHEVAYKKYKGLLWQEKQSKTPQWFKANYNLTLEEIKYSDPYELGMRVKEAFNQLELAIIDRNKKDE
jgi:hypothetical protein